MKKTIFITLFFMISLASLMAQTEGAYSTVNNKVFFVELGGPGVIMSMNYDMRFNSDSRLGFGARGGAGFSVGQFDGQYNEYGYYEGITRSYYSIPVQLNYVFGKETSSSLFEIGAGASFLTRKVALYNYEDTKIGNFIGHISFMYRLQPIRGGFSLRVGFSPMIGTSGDLFPMGAISLGYVF